MKVHEKNKERQAKIAVKIGHFQGELDIEVEKSKLIYQ